MISIVGLNVDTQNVLLLLLWSKISETDDTLPAASILPSHPII
jgi:hypothetical protein